MKHIDEKENIHGADINKWPFHGWFGLCLVVIFWILNWSLSGLRTHWLFFPMWLGYCLTVDGLVFYRKGSSLLTRGALAYFCLFIISIPSWWLFEIINWRTSNWYYEGRNYFTDFQFFLFSSLSFSTVMPAVFETAELAGTFNWIKRLKAGPFLIPGRSVLLFLFATGCIMFLLLLLWPVYFFPLVWISLYFILEPVNMWLGSLSLLRYTSRGDWRPILALWIGCLICGFFWEMWNFYSYPRWIYNLPLVDFFHLFEMPLLGYLGYLPFSMELFAMYHLMTRLFMPVKFQNFVQVCSDK
jgi:hypothetical protein